MDWNTLFNVLAIAAFVFVMIRGCDAGVCGMGSRWRNGEHRDHESHDQRVGKMA